jgi:Tol biopolymer transport system component
MVASNAEGDVSYASLIEVPANGGPERALTQRRWAAGLGGLRDLSWASDGQGLIVTANDRNVGPMQIEYISRSDGKVRKITNDLNSYYGVSLTAGSDLLATVQGEPSWDIWVGSFAEPDSAKPITSGGQAGAPVWSADGRIVYVANDLRGWSIWSIDSEGHNPRTVVIGMGEVGGVVGALPRVSADGHHIVFISDRTGSFHVWRMDIDGNDPKQLTKSPNDDFTIPDVTPDGRWVVYRKKGEEKGIWKVPMAGGDPVRLNETGVGVALAVSPDGKMIAYSYDDPRATPRRGVAIMALDGGPPVKLFDISAGTLRWTTDARFLLYTTEVSGSNIWSQPIAGGGAKQITHFNQAFIQMFDLSSDGKRLVMDRYTESDHVMLIRDLR